MKHWLITIMAPSATHWDFDMRSIDEHPADYVVRMANERPGSKFVLLCAVPITEAQHAAVSAAKRGNQSAGAAS